MRLVNGEYKQYINGVEHWVKIEGAENHTTPLVIIHGGPGGNLYSFERTTGPLLSKNRTIIYYEQRGCGRSGSPDSKDAFTSQDLITDFNDIHEWIGYEKVDLFGYSFGGELALEITHALPSKINKVIISSPSLIGLKTQFLIQIAGFMSIADTTFISVIERILEEQGTIEEKYLRIWKAADISTVDRLFFENQDLAKEYRRLTQESKMNNTGLMLKAIQNNPPVIPLIDRLRDITHDILIITGVHDRNSGIPISNLIHRQLNNSTLILFNKSAHFPYIEESKLFLEQVNIFL
ncbi:alpha/beta fold hydrolase [Robertmurraya korlensis]|uniref:alpha/beta fold hydrolase n=1 Tax=Robertmurraya korlensis TaxID=519977 RepID=UPI00203D8913|nr:alpha/beta fold hydrolase [Robertmurraya korlensis]MCM3601090.1 alpha/beta fold hydrolase [Robertmurraya korlensis]